MTVHRHRSQYAHTWMGAARIDQAARGPAAKGRREGDKERRKHAVDEVFGLLRLRGSVDDLIDAMRGPRPARRSKKRV